MQSLDLQYFTSYDHYCENNALVCSFQLILFAVTSLSLPNMFGILILHVAYMTCMNKNPFYISLFENA